MPYSTTRRSKALCVFLAAALALAFTPIAGCKSEEPPDNKTEETPAKTEPAAAQPTSASEDPGGNADAATIDYDTSTYLAPEKKWAEYDDGAPVLDIVQTHINANANKQTLTVKLEKPGAFSQDIGAGDVAPTGGISAWTVENVTRNSDTEISVDVTRGDSDASAPVGAIVAGVSTSADAVTLERNDTSDIDAALLAQYEEAEKAGELSEEIADDGSVAAESAPVADAPFETNAPFVHPSLLVDVADSEIGANSTSYRIVANEFRFPASLSTGDFTLFEASDDEAMTPVVAQSAAIEGVERLNDFEAVVTVSGDATAADATHDRMALVLSAESNETGGDVSCPLTLPDVWLDTEISQVDGVAVEELAAPADEGAALGSVTVDMTLHNAEKPVEAGDLAVTVLAPDGTRQDLPNAQVKTDGEGNASLTLDVAQLDDVVNADQAESDDGAEDEAVVLIDVANTERAYGGEFDPEEISVSIPLVASALASVETLSVPAVVNSLPGSAIQFGIENILSLLIADGWNAARNALFEGISGAQSTDEKLLASLESMQEQIGSLAAQVDAIESKQTSQYYANIVNEANRIIARIQAQYAIFSSPYEAAMKLAGNEREAALEQIVATNRGTIESMAVNLGELAMFISKADAFSNKGLIDVYDSMAASAYNWKAAASGVRAQYRKTVGDAWSSGSAVLLALLGTPSYSASYGGVLANLQSHTKMVSKAIDGSKDDLNSHTVEAGAYTLVSKSGLVKPTGKAYFCYTTNEWYTFCTGSMSTVKWDRAFAKSKKRGRTFDYDADMPFIAWHNDSASPKWESIYMSTTAAKSLVARSAGNRSLHSEIAMFYPDMPRYILTSVSLDLKPAAQPKNNNIWRSDTFDRTSDSVTELKENMVHFDGYINSWAFKKSEKVSKSSTDMADMAVIAKVTLK